MVCGLKQEPDSDRHGTDKIRVLTDRLAKGDDIAIGEWCRNFGGESDGDCMADLE